MPTAVLVSLIGHVALVALMAFGLPSLLEPDEQRITSNPVGIVTEADLAALSKPQLPPARDASVSQARAAAAKAATDADSTTAKQANTAAEIANAASQQAATAPKTTTLATKQATAAQAASSNAAQARQVLAQAAPRAKATTRPASPTPRAKPAQSPSALVIAQQKTPSLTARNPTPASTQRPKDIAPTPTAQPHLETPPSQPPPIATAAAAKVPDTAEARPLPPRRPTTPTLMASTPEAVAARPADTVEPAKPIPAEPRNPAPREALAQTPQPPRAQARKAPLPPRRPAHLRRPPTQLAEAPAQKQTLSAPKSKSNDAFASLISDAIPTKSSDDRRRAVAETLGVGVSAVSLSKTDQKAIESRLGGCWRPLIGQVRAEDLVVVLSVRLGPTSEVERVRVIEKPPGAVGRAAADRAKQAVQKCSPMNKFGLLKLPADKYRDWRDMRIRFDPRNPAG
jgi:hypothetical protein